MNTQIDLHIHTNYSDGTDSERELLDRLRAEGIKYFSVTDHDTINGAMAVKKLVTKELIFIPGIEFSCFTSDRGKVHILGYNYDENNNDFLMAISEGQNKRKRKLEKRLEHLRKDHGIEFSDEDYKYIYALTSAGKPHLAKLLIKYGYAAEKKEAIEKYIDDKKNKNDITDTRISSKEAVSGILSSGGIPIWAHPLGGINEKRLNEAEFDARLKLLIDEGIKGLECWYSLYNKNEVDFLINKADKNGLLISGGSDYHGKNKTVSLGKLNNFGKDILKEELSVAKNFYNAICKNT